MYGYAIGVFWNLGQYSFSLRQWFHHCASLDHLMSTWSWLSLGWLWIWISMAARLWWLLPLLLPKFDHRLPFLLLVSLLILFLLQKHLPFSFLLQPLLISLSFHLYLLDFPLFIFLTLVLHFLDMWQNILLNSKQIFLWYFMMSYWLRIVIYFCSILLCALFRLGQELIVFECIKLFIFMDLFVPVFCPDNKLMTIFVRCKRNILFNWHLRVLSEELMLESICYTQSTVWIEMQKFINKVDKWGWESILSFFG